jgi:hypothetical protein
LARSRCCIRGEAGFSRSPASRNSARSIRCCRATASSCQGGDVGVEEAVEAAADAVVVERRKLGGIEPEELGDVARGPLAEAMEGSRETRRFLSKRSNPLVVGMRERRSSGGR